MMQHGCVNRFQNQTADNWNPVAGVAALSGNWNLIQTLQSSTVLLCMYALSLLVHDHTCCEGDCRGFAFAYLTRSRKRSSKATQIPATQIQATGAIWCLSDGVSYHPNQISPTWLMRILGEWQERMRHWWLREAGSRGSVELIHRRSLWKPSGGAEDWIMGPDISIEAGHKMGAKSITVGVRGKQSLGSRGSVCVHNAESTHPRRIAASLALLGFHGAADFRRWRQNDSAPWRRGPQRSNCSSEF